MPAALRACPASAAATDKGPKKQKNKNNSNHTFIMPRLKSNIFPVAEENVTIRAGIASSPDACVADEKIFYNARPTRVVPQPALHAALIDKRNLIKRRPVAGAKNTIPMALRHKTLTAGQI